MRDSPRYTVTELNDRGLLRVEDGNHGEYRPRKQEFVESGVAFIRAADLSESGIDFDSASKINEVARARITKGIGQPRDVILSHKGTVGKVAIAPLDAPPFVCSPQTTFWRSLDYDVLDQEFLYAFIRSRDFKVQLDSRAGETDMAGYVSLTAQRTFWVPLPPIVKQREIVSCISALDRKVELNRQMNETLEAMAQAIFKDWFVEFGPTRAKAEGRARYLAPEIWNLFPDSLDDEGKPVGWQSYSASELFEFNPREVLKKGTPSPYLPMAALPTTGPIADAPSRREYKSGPKFRSGDTLFARITPCLENGKTAYIFDLGDDKIGAGSTEFIVIRSRKHVPSFASYLLARDPGFREAAIQSMTGTSGRQRADKDSLAQYKVCAPADDCIWIALGQLTDPLVARLLMNAKEMRALRDTRDLLLPKLMSGEIRLENADQAAEAVA